MIYKGMLPLKPIIQFKNYCLSLVLTNKNLEIIRGINLDIYEGETLAIIGESGSGKSVLCRSLLKLFQTEVATRGQIFFKGEDILSLSNKSIRKLRGKKIAMIFQDPMTSLNPVMKVGTQIREALLEHSKISKKEAKREVISLMTDLGIDDAQARYNNYPHQFSGGQRQRLVIAIAISCKPDILIADEATTALDPTTQKQILELLKSIQNKYKMTVVLISHDLGIVSTVADRVAIMYAGKILEYGTTIEVFYQAKHPYTWGLIRSIPIQGQSLYSIPGNPTSFQHMPEGDAFCERNEYALVIDELENPPFFKVSDTHYAATWLLDPKAPKVKIPKEIEERYNRYEEWIGDRRGGNENFEG